MKRMKDATKIFNSKGQWSILEDENMLFWKIGRYYRESQSVLVWGFQFFSFILLVATIW